MTSRKRRTILLAVTMGITAMFISLILLEMSPALALEQEFSGPVKLAAPEQPPPVDDFVFGVVFTDPAVIPIEDLSGNIIGDGEHTGQVRCNTDNCSQRTQLSFGLPETDPIVYEYRFTTRLALDPEAERVVVAGTGTISSRGQKERFLFTATILNNRDGTVRVAYAASNSDASYVIPRTDAAFRIFRRR